MTGDTLTTDSVTEREARRAIEEALGEALGTRVSVEVYQQRGRYDVQVDLPEVKGAIEERFPDCRATPYSDYKLTLKIEE